MYELLFETIITKEELSHLLASLDTLQDRLYSVRTSPLDQITTLLPFDRKEAFLLCCQKNNIVLENPQSLKQCVTTIRKEAETLPMVQLSVAYTPTEDELRDINNWLKARIGQKYVFAVTVDHSLVGGAVISANGFYKDFSLKRYLEENADEINNAYQKVTK